jgi:hypothetical protein
MDGEAAAFGAQETPPKINNAAAVNGVIAGKNHFFIVKDVLYAGYRWAFQVWSLSGTACFIASFLLLET